MANTAARRPENVAGPLFVDSTCIDCDTCRWMAPQVFGRVGGQSAVVRQPHGAGQELSAAQALVACPTASIGGASPALVRSAATSFPVPITPTVFDCGYHSESSFGATSYLVTAPEGNVMVDCPRWNETLAKRIEGMGGVRFVALTHRDDVADHARCARRFDAQVVLHGRDMPIGGPVHVVLEGEDLVELLPGFTAVPTPGHTAGHVCYLWSGDGGVLFGGDHVAWDDEAGTLEAWPDVCWHDWGEQTQSMARLATLEFEWVMPGHGRRGHQSAADMKRHVERLVAWMEAR